MENRKNILFFTGLITEKFGALERYFVELARQSADTDKHIVFVYNQLPPDKTYLEMLYQYNAEVVELRVDEGYFTMVKNVNKLLNFYKPFAIQTNFVFKQVRAVILLSWLKRVPKRFVTIHSSPGENPPFISQLWYRMLAYFSTKILAVSQKNFKLLVDKFKISPKKIDILRLGIDFSAFDKISCTKNEIREKFGLPKNKTLIGCIAFHKPIKGIDVLLQAVKELKFKYKCNDFMLCQIGGYFGELSPELQNMAKELNIDDSILWLGLRDNVPEFLSAFDIYCQPSRSEGLPMAIIEAFYAGLPIVASNVGGMPEVITDNKNGFLIEIENYEQMAERLNDLLKNENLRKEFGNMGYKTVSKEFNVVKQIDKLLNYYV
ncbi:LPS glycosyltransferase [Bacteroidia bacterium]|nr:LPS glycosyltransferase [Bacteroidia bacterium]